MEPLAFPVALVALARNAGLALSSLSILTPRWVGLAPRMYQRFLQHRLRGGKIDKVASDLFPRNDFGMQLSQSMTAVAVAAAVAAAATAAAAAAAKRFSFSH